MSPILSLSEATFLLCHHCYSICTVCVRQTEEEGGPGRKLVFGAIESTFSLVYRSVDQEMAQPDLCQELHITQKSAL